MGSITIQESYSELIASGPGMLQLESSSQSTDLIDVLPLDSALVILQILPNNAEQPWVVSIDFQYLCYNGEAHEWILRSKNK